MGVGVLEVCLENFLAGNQFSSKSEDLLGISIPLYPLRMKFLGGREVPFLEPLFLLKLGCSSSRGCIKEGLLFPITVLF